MNIRVTLEYNGKTYVITDTDYTTDEFDDAYTDDDIKYQIERMWTDGDLGCDCNKSIYIGDQCDPDFPEMGCGEEILLKSLEFME